MTRLSLHALPALALLAFAGCGGDSSSEDEAAAASGEPPAPLTIWWFQWEPADGLEQLAADFTAETGIAVDVQQIPLSSYQEKVILEFGNARTAFDIVIGDSQWIGRRATKGL